jgi:hypothetical protein
VTAFEIQCRNDSLKTWDTIHQGQALDPHGIIEFSPWMARYFRIQIIEAAGGTGLTRIRLFSPPDEQTRLR